MKTTHGKCAEESQQCFFFTVCEHVFGSVKQMQCLMSVQCRIAVRSSTGTQGAQMRHKGKNIPTYNNKKMFICIKRVEHNKHVKCRMFCSLYLHSVMSYMSFVLQVGLKLRSCSHALKCPYYGVCIFWFWECPAIG